MNETVLDQNTSETSESLAEGNDNTSWTESLPENLRGSDSLKKFKSAADLADSYVNLEKRFYDAGRDKAIYKPDDNAPPEAWDGFYKRLGRPETKDDYKLQVDETTKEQAKINDELLERFKEKAYETGLNSKQAEQVFNLMADSRKEVALADQEAVASSLEDAQAALKREWGHDYDSKIATAKRAYQKFADAKDAKTVAKYGNDPAFVRLMANMGARFKPDTLITDSTETSTESPESLRSEAKRMMEDKDQGFFAGNRDTVQKVQSLYQRADQIEKLMNKKSG